MGVAANQVLIQQPGVAENPHRHEPIHGGLEFQQQIHIQPMILKPDSPDDIVMTVTQVIGDVAGVHFLQRREVQRLDPGLRHETLQQVFDHLGVGEQQFVAGVVHDGSIAPVHHGERDLCPLNGIRSDWTAGRRWVLTKWRCSGAMATP